MAELTPEERERIYQEEKARLEAKKELESEELDKYIASTLCGMLLAFAGGACGFFLGGLLGAFIFAFVGVGSGFVLGIPFNSLFAKAVASGKAKQSTPEDREQTKEETKQFRKGKKIIFSSFSIFSQFPYLHPKSQKRR